MDHSSDDLQHPQGELEEVEASIADSVDFLLEEPKDVDVEGDLLLEGLPLFANLGGVGEQVGDVADQRQPLLQKQSQPGLFLDAGDRAEHVGLFDPQGVADVDRLEVGLLLEVAAVPLEVLEPDHPFDLVHLPQLELLPVPAGEVEAGLDMPQGHTLVLPHHESQLLVAQIAGPKHFPQTAHKVAVSVLLRYLDDLAVTPRVVLHVDIGLDLA